MQMKNLQLKKKSHMWFQKESKMIKEIKDVPKDHGDIEELDFVGVDELFKGEI